MQPVIAITGRPKTMESVGQPMRAYAVFHTYSDGVIAAGGLPIMLVPSEVTVIDAILDRVDGVLFTGGGDVDPKRYGAEPRPELEGVSTERDEYELKLARRVKARQIPTLAICRGMQVLNVAFGGTLVQDLPAERNAQGHDRMGEEAWAAHSIVTIDTDSAIADVIGAGDHGINSIHHQAVDELGNGLRVVGRALDGTIESIEHEDRAWPMIAVQWHPEFLRYRADHASVALFTNLVESAAKYRADR